MKLSETLKNLQDTNVQKGSLSTYLSNLYQDKNYSSRHEEYKKGTYNKGLCTIKLIQLHKKRAKKLINEIVRLSNKQEFLQLLKHFKNTSPGLTRITSCYIMEALELITYKLSNNLLFSPDYFYRQLTLSTFNACAAGALTHVENLLHSMESSLYSAKKDYITDNATNFARTRLIYEKSNEVHIINTILKYIEEEYNIIIPYDMHAAHVDDRSSDILNLFKNHLNNTFGCRKGAYEFISLLSNTHILSIEQYATEPFLYEETSPELSIISNASKECGLDISSILECATSEDQVKCRLNERFREYITIGLTAKLIKDKIIDHQLLFFTEKLNDTDYKKHTIIQTPLGWYEIECDNFEDIANLYINEDIIKTIDAKDIQGLTISGNNIEDYLSSQLIDKQQLSFDEALRSIGLINRVLPDELSIKKRLFLISDAGQILRMCFSSYDEALSLTDEQLELWRSIITSKNTSRFINQLCYEKKLGPLIKSKHIDSASLYPLTRYTGKSHLHIAALIENIELVKFLLGYGQLAPLVDVNLKDSNGDTALNIAIGTQNIDLIKTFLDNRNIDINIQNQQLKTAIHIALGTENIEIINLLSITEQTRIIDHWGNDLLMTALIIDSKPAIIEALIKHKRININHKNKFEQTHMHMAIYCENSENIIQLLYDTGYPASEKDKYGDTPLHYASAYGNLDAVKKLYSFMGGSGLHLASHIGRTPITNSIYHQKLDVLQFFLEKIRQENLNIDGSMILHYTIQSESPIYFIEAILPYIKNWSTKHETLIHSSLMYPDPRKLLQLLYDNGADCNLRDEYGNTALHDACYAGNFIAVETLLSFPSIDVNAVNNDGDTPLHGMMFSGGFSKEICELLIKSEAHITIKNKKGQTPIDILREQNSCFLSDLDEVIKSKSSKKRTLSEATIQNIQYPMVPETPDAKRSNSQSLTCPYSFDNIPATPIINNIENHNNIMTISPESIDHSLGHTL